MFFVFISIFLVLHLRILVLLFLLPSLLSLSAATLIIPSSYLCRDTDCPRWYFLRFPQSFQVQWLEVGHYLCFHSSLSYHPEASSHLIFPKWNLQLIQQRLMAEEWKESFLIFHHLVPFTFVALCSLLSMFP
jgi:hypothetical protein